MARILVVETDEGVAALLVDYFTSNDYEVCTARSADQALRVLKIWMTGGQPFDFVITANRLPDRDGTELVSAIKDQFPRVHILLMSGLWKGPLPKGIAAFYEKPFDVEEMLVCIKRCQAAA